MPEDNVELVGLMHAAYKRGELEDAIDTYLHPEKARALDRDRVLATYRLHGAGRASGIPTEMTIYEIDTFKDGQILRRQVFYSEAEALDAAGVKGD